MKHATINWIIFSRVAEDIAGSVVTKVNPWFLPSLLCQALKKVILDRKPAGQDNSCPDLSDSSEVKLYIKKQ